MTREGFYDGGSPSGLTGETARFADLKHAAPCHDMVSYKLIELDDSAQKEAEADS